MTSTLSFFGGVGAVTGANFLLELKTEKGGVYKIVVDCGLLQGVQHADDFNHSHFSYDPSSVDVLLITHAHADHIGRVAKLIKDGFHGVIYSTPATLDLVKVMLDDQLSLITRDAEAKGIEPMYTKKDVEKTLSLWNTIPYHTLFKIKEDVTLYFKDAGHILGSAMIEIVRNGKKIVFTGDLGNSPSLFLRDTESITDAHYMVMESVYGDRNHEPKDMRRLKLKTIIQRVIAERKTLVIPVFSLERTQDILYEINDLVESKQIDPVPTFIDSPLAIKVTDIYRQWAREFKQDIQERIKSGDDIFDFSKLKMVAHMKDSSSIQDISGPKIIMAGSGMSSGGRIVFHEKRFLPDKDAILLFVGYQSMGTLGRKIEEGAKKVIIQGEEIKVNAEIESINGYSSHKDSDHLVEFASESSGTLKQVFIAMGEPKAAMFLAQRMRDYAGIKAVCPELGNTYTLDL